MHHAARLSTLAVKTSTMSALLNWSLSWAGLNVPIFQYVWLLSSFALSFWDSMVNIVHPPGRLPYCSAQAGMSNMTSQMPDLWTAAVT